MNSAKKKLITGAMKLATKGATVGRRSSRGAREKLLAAAHSVIGQKGIDGSTIGEIVAEAGVGVGSFYNHFNSKEELAREVFAVMTDEIGAHVRDIVLTIPDPAVATCLAYRALINQAETDPIWGTFIAQLEPSLQLLDSLLRKYALVGLRLGITSGRFEVQDPEIAVTLIHAMVVRLIQELVRGEITSERAHMSAAYPLRMLGVPLEEAAALCRISFDELLVRAGVENDTVWTSL